MKKWSIKRKVTLWYTLFMTILVILIQIILFSVGNSQMLQSLSGKLRSAVNDSVSELEYEDGRLEIDDDLDFFRDGVYLSIYDAEGILLFGHLPTQVPIEETPFFYEDQIQESTIQGTHYLIYDIYTIQEEQGFWIRGVISKTEAESNFGIMIRLTAVALPVLTGFIALGGYYITKRAFRPVEQIRKTAEEIAHGGDLSKRIELGNGKDEIYQLGETFDYMLDRLEESFEREKQFTSDASHELRTPTSVILAQSEYALKNAATLEDARESLTVIFRQAKRMSSLISQLLTLARADRGKIKPNLEMLDISELLEITILEMQTSAGEKGISISTDIEEPHIKMLADETMLMRIFVNLLQNAVIYGRENGWIHVSLKEQNQEIQIVIQDNGIGMEKDKLDKIWERFYQVNPSREKKDSGSSGLGLSMVKWMVGIHNGSISVDSQVNRGTIFTIKFPKKMDI